VTVVSPLIERALPGERLVEIPLPSESAAGEDVRNLKLTVIERSLTVSLTGAAFFEQEETTKQYKMLYKEKPQLTVTIRANGETLKTLPLTQSHLFEFTGLERGQEYEITLRSGRVMMDLRHETQTTLKVIATDTNPFLRVVLPLKGKQKTSI